MLGLLLFRSSSTHIASSLLQSRANRQSSHLPYVLRGEAEDFDALLTILSISEAAATVQHVYFRSDDEERIAGDALSSMMGIAYLMEETVNTNPSQPQHDIFLHYFPEGTQTLVLEVFKTITQPDQNGGIGNAFFNNVVIRGQPPNEARWSKVYDADPAKNFKTEFHNL